jgi:PAS domain S-box-containing protein
VADSTAPSGPRDPRLLLWQLVADGGTTAAVVLDASGTVLLWNDAAERVFGRSSGEIVGRRFDTIAPERSPSADPESSLSAGLDRARSTGRWAGVVSTRRVDGRIAHAQVEISTLGPDEVGAGGALLLASDVTELREELARLSASEAHRRELVASDPDAVAVTDALGIITEVNRRMEELTGRPRSELERHRWASLFEDPVAAEAGLHAVLVERRRTDWDLRLRGADGNPISVDVSAATYGSPRGGVGGMVLRVRDVSDRRGIETQLRESQAYNRGLIEASIDALFSIDPNGVVTDLNRQSEVAVGLRRDQILGTRFADLFTDPAAASAALAATLTAGTASNLEFTLKPAAGPTRVVSLNASVFRGEFGDARGIFAAARDVSEQKEAESRLRASQSYHRSLIEASPDVLLVVDSAMTISDVNEQALRVTGFGREELTGSAFRDLFADPRRAVMGVQQTLANGALANYELTLRLRSGHELLVSASASVLRSAEGQVQGVVFVARDMTAQRALEHRLREARNYNRGLIEASLDGLITVDPELAITDVNEQMLKLTGLTRKQLLASRFPELFVETDRAAATVRAALERHQVTGSELTVNRRTGPGLPVSVNAGTFADPTGGIRGVLVAARDFTENKRLESELREAQGYSRSVIDSNIDALFTTDLLGRITDVNQEMEALAGVPREGLIGTPFRDRVTDAAAAEELTRRVLAENRVVDLELGIRHASGTTTPVSCNAAIFFDKEGRLKGVIATARDVTEPLRLREQLQRQNRELTVQNQRVLEANRLKSEFLASMSHELRTPLNSIIGFSDFLITQESAGLSAEAREYLGDILASGNHLLQLINDILDLAKVESGKMDVALATFSPRAAVEEVMTSVRPLAAEKRITLALRADPGLTSVVLDPLRFKQILYNLLSNAIKFTEDGGPAEVGLVRRDPGQFTLSVRDSGIGIAATDLPRLFREFEQLETGPGRHFGGSGLGLSLTKKLVDLLGGSIEVESEVGAGTTFSVHLPLAMTTGPDGSPPGGTP